MLSIQVSCDQLGNCIYSRPASEAARYHQLAVNEGSCALGSWLLSACSALRDTQGRLVSMVAVVHGALYGVIVEHSGGNGV
jgi:hypothetical protein